MNTFNNFTLSAAANSATLISVNIVSLAIDNLSMPNEKRRRKRQTSIQGDGEWSYQCVSRVGGDTLPTLTRVTSGHHT